MNASYVAFDIDHTLFHHEPSWEADQALIRADWDYFTKTDEFIRTAKPNPVVIAQLLMYQADPECMVQLITARGNMDHLLRFVEFMRKYDVDVHPKDIIFCGSNSPILAKYPNTNTAMRKSLHIRDTLEDLRVADVMIEDVSMYDDDLDNLTMFLRMSRELKTTRATAMLVIDGKQMVPYFNV